MEILPSKQFESHSQSANGLKRPFGIKNYKFGPCHGADFYKNDTLSRSRNPENDTLFSGTSPYRKYMSTPPPGDYPTNSVEFCMLSNILGCGQLGKNCLASKYYIASEQLLFCEKGNNRSIILLFALFLLCAAHTNRFCVVQENIKPEVLKVQTELARSVN